MLPVDLTVVGTVHSHPSGALRPSDADLRLFRSWGRRHLILGQPFGPSSWKAYDGNGRETRLEVVGAAGPAPPLPSYRPASERRPAGEDEPLDDEA